MEQGWYYLHTNGDLIYKRELGGTAADIRESDFAKQLGYKPSKMWGETFHDLLNHNREVAQHG